MIREFEISKLYKFSNLTPKMGGNKGLKVSCRLGQNLITTCGSFDFLISTPKLVGNLKVNRFGKKLVTAWAGEFGIFKLVAPKMGEGRKCEKGSRN